MNLRSLIRGAATRRGRWILVYVACCWAAMGVLFLPPVLTALGHPVPLPVGIALSTTILAVLVFGAYLPARRYRRRLDAGQCVQCGYDLTGNVSGICPECGGGGGSIHE